MPNLIITDRCNRHCSYCFNAHSGADLTPKKLYDLLPLLNSFKREKIHILGGEPSLNPYFLDIVDILLAEGYKIRIFTNGNLSTDQIQALVLRQSVAITLDVNRSNPELVKDIKNLYRRLGHCIQSGVTVYHTGQDFTHLFAEINRYHLEPLYRIGIAMPIWPHRANTSLYPTHYTQAAQQIFRQIQQGLLLGITPEFDCGFPDCFFTVAQKNFFRQHQIKFAALCGLIPDICSESCFPCFPLTVFAEPIQVGATWTELEAKLMEKLGKIPLNYIFTSCETCASRLSGSCPGGCLGWRLSS